MAVYLAVAVSAVLPVLMSGRSPQRLPAAGWRSRRSHAAGAPQMMQFDELGERWTASGGSSIGVLLLSVGSPETPDDVEVHSGQLRCRARRVSASLACLACLTLLLSALAPDLRSTCTTSSATLRL
jgi:hypothetical protein